MTRRRITFVTRTSCSICDDAEPMVRESAARFGLDVDVIDVDEAGLAAEYGEMVPVVLGPEGDVLAWGRIRPLRLSVGLLAVRIGVGGKS